MKVSKMAMDGFIPNHPKVRFWIHRFFMLESSIVD
jgi:hypothetical protein